MEFEYDDCSGYSQFVCIGTGFSGIGLGATLKRWYGITDIQFFERHDDLGGTWHENTYPGDFFSLTPSHLFPLLTDASRRMRMRRPGRTLQLLIRAGPKLVPPARFSRRDLGLP